MTTRLLCLPAAAGILFLSSCETTSLSDPGGSGHQGDLNLYELTGAHPSREVTEADIRAARSGRRGSLPPQGTRVLLVQSGAHQPDEELMAAFRPLCQPVMWDGRAIDSGDEKKSGGSAGRRLRLVGAQQNCSHVIVVFGEIQSQSRALPTDALVGWVPVVGDIVPTSRSGTRLITQAVVMETGAPRYSLVTAQPREERGVTTAGGGRSANVSRTIRMKQDAYPELAANCFRR